MNAVNERRQQLQSQSASAFEDRMRQFGELARKRCN